MLSCRHATRRDAPALFEMLRELAAHEGSPAALQTDLERFCRDGFGPQPRFAAVLAELDGRQVGYVSYTRVYAIWRGATTLAIDDVYVRAACRGRGIGEAMLRWLHGFAAQTGANRLRWEVNARNASAIRFYERLGAAVTTKGFCAWEVPERVR
ncbi:GNAT superfamily N-acetyltransferase [Pelomonas saccharophila]|uniref:GNAT superfamily N-acetyltransferase n=1 Tax=Roseateles saccharophilus TaxID=304 RepID=A0ABU1YK84_ROSSA|nr:GNAT family N-acetyltransferase [Roseateles saccharophilus]MDR7268610.1 GNAT superfamily N-acetyltransferase [Roseateles saccharophilus]